MPPRLLVDVPEPTDCLVDTESDTRRAVAVSVGDIAAPTATSPQSFCSINSPTIDDIAITGTNIIWYTAASGGSVVTAGTALVDGTTYYASQTVGGCESDTRRAVAVSVGDIAAPTATSPQSFCSINSPTIDDIAITALVEPTLYYASHCWWM